MNISSEKTISVLTIVCLIVTVFSCNSELSIPERQSGRQTHQPAKDQTKGSTFTINLNTDNCAVDIEEKLGLNSFYEEEIIKNKRVRKITINSIPSHAVGAFPNEGNPNTIKAQNKSFNLPLNPTIASRITMRMGFQTGVLF